jgi:hypothetical protein
MMKRLTGIALVLTVAAVASAAAATAPGASQRPAAQPPAKQIAALKRQIATLKRQLVALRAENKRLAAFSPAGITGQLEKTKTALDKYQSVDQAKADGYLQASPCEALAAFAGAASSYAGAMGFHYVSQAAMTDGTLDPAKPEILLYAPVGSSLQLIGAEYFKPDADQNVRTDSDRPTLFGRAFDGPMLGHAPGMPIHYDLHVWLWKANPSGLFAPWNPDASCKST